MDDGNLPPSPADIALTIGKAVSYNRNYYTHFVQGFSKRYAVIITDLKAAQDFYENQLLNDAWENMYRNSSLLPGETEEMRQLRVMRMSVTQHKSMENGGGISNGEPIATFHPGFELFETCEGEDQQTFHRVDVGASNAPPGLPPAANNTPNPR